jgi:hypothetical protein
MYEMKSKNRRVEARAALRPLGAPALFFAALLLLNAPLHGFDASLSGSYKSYLNWIYDPAWESDSYGVSTGMLRLKASLYPTERSSVELAYLIYPEIRPDALSNGSRFLDPGTGAYRVIDLRRRLLPWSSSDVNNLGLYNELDRAAVTFRFPFADLSLGRQAVAWGSSRIVNTTDVIVPVEISTLDTEYREGVDALRLRIPLGAMHEIDLGYVFGKEFRFDRSAAFGRAKLYVLETDVGALAMLFQENLMIGLDLARAIGDAGSWLEAAYVVPDVVGGFDDPWADGYFRISSGLDYNLSGELYGYVEYHFNSPGAADASGYLQLPDDPAYSGGATYLLGRHYLGVGATYNLTPLLPATGRLLANLNDLSVMLSLSVEYNIKENVYLGGGCYLGFGENPSVSTIVPGQIQEYRSEFGAYPNLFYTTVKLYF